MLKPFSSKVLLASLFGGAALLLSPSLEAATITWGTATNNTSETNVITTGTFVSAYQMSSGSANTVNGVTFAPTQGTSISNGSSVTFGTGAGALTLNPISDSLNSYAQNPDAAPFNSFSASYRTLLGTSFYINGGGNANLTLSGLTVGTNYVLQFWSNDPNAQSTSGGRITTLTSGNAVNLLSNVGNNTAGGLGQFVTGTFTADATTETINASIGNNLAYVNGLQLRVAAVPEPSTYVMLLVGGCFAMVAYRRNRREA